VFLLIHFIIIYHIHRAFEIYFICHFISHCIMGFAPHNKNCIYSKYNFTRTHYWEVAYTTDISMHFMIKWWFPLQAEFHLHCWPYRFQQLQLNFRCFFPSLSSYSSIKRTRKTDASNMILKNTLNIWLLFQQKRLKRNCRLKCMLELS